LHQKCQNQDYQNTDRFSVCRILLLQRKPKLGRMRMRPAGRGLDMTGLIEQYVLSCDSIPEA